MTETMVSSLFRWLYSNLEYPRFICFLYLPCVFRIGTCSYLAGITLSAWSTSLTISRFFSLSYACRPVNTWLLFRWRNNGILAYRNTRNMILANLTYLDSLNRYIVFAHYYTLTKLRRNYQRKRWFLQSHCHDMLFHRSCVLMVPIQHMNINDKNQGNCWYLQFLHIRIIVNWRNPGFISSSRIE
jgi:hypothetical protein